ncbi:MAG: ABC transporter permease subunit [Microbacteriaceae bacterium]
MNYLLDAFAWIAYPAQWNTVNGIPFRLVEHLLITVLSVLAAALIALPLGVLIGHTRKGSTVIAALAGAARAVPTLGILTLFGLMLGIGLQAPILALIILAIPSMLAASYSGIEDVDAITVGAAKALGMNSAQIIFGVEIPLALPVIIGGIRASTLQVVATATLAAYTADFGLGRYLFSGLKSRDYPQMLAGAILVVLLALC